MEKSGGVPFMIERADEIDRADLLVLPGVGNFGEAVRRLTDQGLFRPIREYIEREKPFLGICLGLQLLFESSEEAPKARGLAVLPGAVRRFPPEIDSRKLIVPSIGWNKIRVNRGNPSAERMFDGLDDQYFYFVHSYYVEGPPEDCVAARSEYGVPYISAVARPSLYAAQFHPEKSTENGLGLLSNIFAQV